MAFATRNASPPRKNARSESVPPGQGKTHCEVRLQTRPQCTISSTILSLILSGLPVMYCSFTLISYQWENQFLLAIIINLLINLVLL